MRNSILLLCFLPLFFLQMSCTPDTSDSSMSADAITDEMIGQLLMLGFRGKTIDEVSPAIKEQLQAGQIGNIVLFDYDVPTKKADRNVASPEQVKTLVNDLQSLATTPLMVAIDQEGGRVNRLKPAYGFPALPSAQYLGTLNNLDSTAYYAQLNANNLRSLGINVNFAPVVDLNSNPENPVIGGIERSFSADPAQVIAHSRVWTEAHQAKGILSVLKHFPGHGSSTSDSHVGFTDITNTWQPNELEPYKTLLKEDLLLGVMTAHVFNRSIDSIYPATLSPEYIQGILRDDIGYEGVVFSDDIQMKAVHALFEFDVIIEQALAAGVDILVCGNNLEYDEGMAPKMIATIRRLMEEGKVSPERIMESYERVQAVKGDVY